MKHVKSSDILTKSTYRLFRAEMIAHGSTGTYKQEDLLASISGLTRSEIQAIIDHPEIIAHLFTLYGAELYSRGVIASEDLEDADALLYAQDKVFNSLVASYNKYKTAIHKIETDISSLLALADVIDTIGSDSKTRTVDASRNRTTETVRDRDASGSTVNRFTDTPDDVTDDLEGDNYLTNLERSEVVNIDDETITGSDEDVLDQDETEEGTQDQTITENRDMLSKLEKLKDLSLDLYSKMYRDFSSIFSLQ